VTRLVQQVPPRARILDLGCGSAPVLELLAARSSCASYLGLDFSQPLLDLAAQGCPQPLPFPVRFEQADLFEPDWAQNLCGSFDCILSFAFLHHLPSHAARQAFLRRVYALLDPAGRFFFSTWQITRSSKLRSRILPWTIANLSESDVEPGDYLIDWRQGGVGYRYVHEVGKTERIRLARASGFKEEETFASDGEQGNLSDYSVWRPQSKDTTNSSVAPVSEG
jgi:SAM-dependent methyltransferase